MPATSTPAAPTTPSIRATAITASATTAITTTSPKTTTRASRYWVKRVPATPAPPIVGLRLPAGPDRAGPATGICLSHRHRQFRARPAAGAGRRLQAAGLHGRLCPAPGAQRDFLAAAAAAARRRRDRRRPQPPGAEPGAAQPLRQAAALAGPGAGPDRPVGYGGRAQSADARKLPDARTIERPVRPGWRAQDFRTH
ncbi:hypothetical protein G6F65_016888 [Rhizopus arrhizus]|nr:hypothetical protein G6F65_016888 [Rhizopus arrhizus]